MTTKRLLTATLVLALGLGLGLMGVNWTSSAHESATVGPYKITFGGTDEPLITGERMWLKFEVLNTETEEPAEGLTETLTFSVDDGAKKQELNLGSVHGEPGNYKAAVIITEAGPYEFHIEGEINGTMVHKHFEKEVLDRKSLSFPGE